MLSQSMLNKFTDLSVTRRFAPSLLAIGIAGMFLGAAEPARAQPYNFTGASGTSWDTAANWTLSTDASNHQVPGTTSTAAITSTTVTKTGTISVATLNLQNAVLQTPSLSFVAPGATGVETVNFLGATASRIYSQTAMSGTLSIGTGVSLIGNIGQLGGTLSLGYNYLSVLNNGTITNNVTGGNIAFDGPSLVNNGTISKTGTGTLLLNTGFGTATNASTGIVTVDGGTLNLDTTTNNGTINVSNGTFYGYNGTPVLSGTGTYNFTNATISGHDTTIQNASSITFNGATVQGTRLNLSSIASITGSSLLLGSGSNNASLSINSNLTLNLTSMGSTASTAASAGYVAIAANSVLTLGANNNVTSALNFSVGANAGVVNNGTITGDLLVSLGDGSSTFTNNGSIQLTGGAGIAAYNSLAPIINSASGTISISGGGSTSVYNVTNNGTYAQTGGTFNATTLKGAGTYALNSLSIGGYGNLPVFDGTILSANSLTLPSLYITLKNGATITGSSLIFTSDGSRSPNSTYADAVRVSGSGTVNTTINAQAPGSILGDGSIPTQITLGANFAVQGSFSGIDVYQGNRSNLAVVNNGVLSPGSASASVYCNTLTNNGVISSATPFVPFYIGAAQSMTNAGTINVSSGGATLTLGQGYVQTAGSTLVNGTLYISNGGTLTLNGGTLSGTGYISTNGGAAATVDNEKGSVLPGASGVVGTLNTPNFTQGQRGTLTIDVAGTSSGNYDILNVYGHATFGGTVVLNPLGGYVAAQGDTYSFLTYQYSSHAGAFDTVIGPNSNYLTSLSYDDSAQKVTATVGASAAGASSVAANQTLGNGKSSTTLVVTPASFTNNGSVAAANGGNVTISPTGGQPTTSSGNINSGSGSAITFSTGLTQSAGNTNVAGTLTLGSSGSGVLNLNGGTLTGSGGTINGTVNVNSGGTINPGNSPGSMTVNGNYNLAGGTETVELGGYGQGTTYDYLNVTGAATLNGTLSISLYGGFLPNNGDVFYFFDYGSESGDYTSITGPTGYVWSEANGISDPLTGRTGSRLTLVSGGGNAAAPEPAALALLLPALPLFAAGVRRKTSRKKCL